MFKKLSFALYLSSAILITLSLSISLQSLLAAWTAPAAVAPSGNVYPPINGSTADQIKLGGLGLGGNLTVSGNSSFAGNVGIGTTTPSHLLHVVGSGTSANFIHLNSNYNLALGNLVNAGNPFILFRGTNSTTNTIKRTSSAAPMGLLYGSSEYSNDKISMVTGSSGAAGGVTTISDVMTWTASGNVGIGTTTPSSNLHIYSTASSETGLTVQNNGSGNPVVRIKSSANYGADLFLNSNGIDMGYLWAANSIPAFNMVATAGNELRFHTNGAGSPNMVISTSGNVGIGKIDPFNLLHLYKTSGNNAELDIQSVSGANKHWAIYHDRATDDLRFWNNTPSGEKNILTITNEGNVGIGTTNQGIYKLNVVGDAYVSGNNGNVLTKTSTGGVTNDGLPNCAAGAYLKWDGAKWICAMSPSGDKHYFITSSIYDGNLGGYSGANDKCNADSSALPGKAYYAAMGAARNGWGMTGVQYFNIIYGKGEVMTNCYSDAASFPDFWLDFPDVFGSCSGWTTTGDVGGYGRFIANCNGAIAMGETYGTGNTDSCTNKKPLLCVEY